MAGAYARQCYVSCVCYDRYILCQSFHSALVLPVLENKYFTKVRIIVSHTLKLYYYPGMHYILSMQEREWVGKCKWVYKS